MVREFGAGILRADGTLDRAALGRIVFADPAALARLESIIHPAVRPRILSLIADAERSGAPAVVIEAIKLVEGGLAALCDEVWLVTCDPAVAASNALPAARGAGSRRRAAAPTRKRESPLRATSSPASRPSPPASSTRAGPSPNLAPASARRGTPRWPTRT